jgi:arginase
MIAVPFHLGRHDVEVGRGPSTILQSLGRPGYIVERANSAVGELDAVADLNAQLARAVATHRGAPLVLAGNCSSCVGTLAGLAGKTVDAVIGVVWFDAHGDFNTPETTISGALEGMSLAIATGSCHDELRRRIGLAQPIAESNVLLVATRSLDPAERVRLEHSSIGVIPLTDLRRSVDQLAKRVEAIYLHLDLDVLDPALSPGVNFSAAGGLAPDDLYAAIPMIAAAVPIAAATIANFNPDHDRDHRTLKIAERLVDILSDASVK